MSAPIAIAGGRSAQQLVRYLAQQVAALNSTATDYNRLSVLRTISEIMALLGERFEEELLVVSAEGIDRATYRSFGFSQQPATQAYGTVLFLRSFTGSLMVPTTVVPALTLPAGVIIAIPNTSRRYLTYQPITFPSFTQDGFTSNQVLYTTILAESPGSGWNTNAGTITTIISSVSDASESTLSVANPGDITSGADDEDDESRRLRFREYIQGIHRATANAIEYGVRTNAILKDSYGIPTELISSAQVLDSAFPGIATCYVWNGIAFTPPAVSATLQTFAQRVVNGYVNDLGEKVPGFKAAGALVNVVPATIVPASVNVAVYPAPGFTLPMVSEGVKAAVTRVFARQQVGDALLKESDLRYAIGAVRGVIDHSIISPARIGDPLVAPGKTVTVMPGGILTPTVAPTLGTTSVTSTLVLGLWTIKYTFYNGNGETVSSPTATQNLATSNNLGITVGNLTIPTNATGIRYYGLAPGGGSYGLMGVSTTGTGVTLTTAPNTGSPPPTLNTTATPATVGTALLGAGNYQVAYSYKTSGGQTLTAPTTAAQAVASGEALFVSIPGSVLEPAVAPSGTTTSIGSTLVSGTYNVVYTYINSVGETLPSAASANVVLATSNNLGIVVPAVPLPANATGVKYYLKLTTETVYGYGGTNSTGASITITSKNTTITPTTLNTTGTLPAGVTGINWYVSIAPYTVTPTSLAYAKTSAIGNTVISLLPTDQTKLLPTGNTSANIGGGDGTIIVPASITVVQGT